MKISQVVANNRRRCFVVRFGQRELPFPYSRCEPPPTPDDPIVDLYVDKELARRGFTYVLKSGRDGCVLLDFVLDHNSDPAYVRDAILYKLTIEAQTRVATCRLSKREIIRKLSSSASQFYRLLDQTNYRKTLDQMVKLLVAIGCEVGFAISPARTLAPNSPRPSRGGKKRTPSRSGASSLHQTARARPR